MLKTAKIEHYKSLSDVSIGFENLTVFVGRNSVGKSNIIESLLFVRDCLDRGVDAATSDRHGVDSILQWSRYRPFNLEIQLSYVDKNSTGLFILKLGSKHREPVILLESGEWTDGETGQRVAYRREGSKISLQGVEGDLADSINRSESVIDQDNLFLRQLQLLPFKSYRQFTHLSRLIYSTNSYSIFPNTLREPQRPSSEHMLSHNGDNLTSILREMASSKASRTRMRYQEIISLMKRVIPNLERILVRNLSGLLWLNFEVSETDGKSHQLNVSQISDGALRILGILVALYQPNPPRLIAVEEPEQNLHPGALGLLADAFNDRASDTQIVITTHSPHLIDHFAVESLRNVALVDGSSKVSTIRPPQKAAIKEGLLTAGEIMVSQGFSSGIAN